ncbi:TIGR01244 family sulfur transferase [Nereida sp.]|uniref:TIGR01244 family sulfur transferase n=1 Tax=Nereida sp. TaxID=2736090 RepID=UPI003F6A0DC5
MDLRVLTPDFAVAPQIEPQDLYAVAEAGYKTVICNRPDAENPAFLHVEEMQKAADAAGLTLLLNQFASPMLSMEHVTKQAELLQSAEGRVFAYCASGTRSTMVWCLAMAGQLPTNDIIEAAARGGYQMEGLRLQIEALAKT